MRLRGALPRCDRGSSRIAQRTSAWTARNGARRRAGRTMDPRRRRFRPGRIRFQRESEDFRPRSTLDPRRLPKIGRGVPTDGDPGAVAESRRTNPAGVRRRAAGNWPAAPQRGPVLIPLRGPCIGKASEGAERLDTKAVPHVKQRDEGTFFAAGLQLATRQGPTSADAARAGAWRRVRTDSCSRAVCRTPSRGYENGRRFPTALDHEEQRRKVACRPYKYGSAAARHLRMVDRAGAPAEGAFRG